MKRAGKTWIPDDDEYFSGIFAGCDVFEGKNLATGLKHVSEWDCAIDGGAHVGSWSRALADKFRMVYAFEPNTVNYMCLLANMADAGKRNVECRRLALGNKYGTIKLSPGSNSGCWHVDESGPSTAGMIPLDQFRPLRQFRVGYIKLDVEGYEWYALNGATELLVRDKPIVQIEEKKLTHSYKCPTARELLEALGYEQVDASGRDVIFQYLGALPPEAA